MSPDCGLKTQIVLHSSGTKPRLKLQQRVNWMVGWVERSETQHKKSYQLSAVSYQSRGGVVLCCVALCRRI